MYRTIKRCEKIGNVKNHAISGRPVLTTISKKFDVAEFIIEDPNHSICKANIHIELYVNYITIVVLICAEFVIFNKM